MKRYNAMNMCCCERSMGVVRRFAVLIFDGTKPI